MRCRCEERLLKIIDEQVQSMIDVAAGQPGNANATMAELQRWAVDVAIAKVDGARNVSFHNQQRESLGSVLGLGVIMLNLMRVRYSHIVGGHLHGQDQTINPNAN